MKSNYKRLGDYIQAVNRRNVNCDITDLRGLSLTKEFRKSTSNIVGTDMSTYKIMHKYDLAANFMGLGVLVDKAAIVLKMDETPNIVSGAYPVFKVKNENELHPEYLMMWLIRSEFDRFCVFKSDRGIRGGFDWNDLLETELPIPSVTKQREIVKEYNVIQNRIALNQQLIQKLEETAQAIYMNVIEENQCEEYSLKDLCSFQEGYVNPSQEYTKYFDGNVKWLRANDVNGGFILNTSRKLTEEGFNSAGTSALLFKPQTIVITKSGTIGRLGILCDYMCGNRAVINIKPKEDTLKKYDIN